MAETRVRAGTKRVVIDRVEPQVDGGLYPVKRIIGDNVTVIADVLCDGHDMLRVVVRYRSGNKGRWTEVPMSDQGNDRWSATFSVDEIGRWEFTVVAWVDHLLTWREGLRKKAAANVVEAVDLLVGEAYLRQVIERGRGKEVQLLTEAADYLGDSSNPLPSRIARALDDDVIRAGDRFPDYGNAVSLPVTLPVWVDRKLAGFSAWYELFPRSATDDVQRHGTFRDVIKRLPYVSRLGFDILYLPPIHPVGVTARKGKNNAVTASPEDPGSPWAIGSKKGGHLAIHPQLGTLKDFRALVAAAAKLEIEIALDIAFQCAPDHPWVTEHPQWFVQRPDGSVQYAENPPKKYQDIYPLNFETPDWEALWGELLNVFRYWVAQGVRVFRVDNPHTKSFPFWDWVIEQIHSQDPTVIFLAEAFTRPRRMYRLAKGGFSQSYTYFTWRNSPAELRDYLTELTREAPKEFFRPNFWPNTPDILHEDLQTGGRAAHVARLILASTLSSNYGIYGPVFELQESTPYRPGSEEYLNSEKYEIRAWNLDETYSLAPLISTINGIRRTNPALQSNQNLRFHAVDNDHLLCYSKSTDNGDNVVLVCVNMDYQNGQSGWVEFSPASVGLDQQATFAVKDLLTGISYTWHGTWNYIALRPADVAAHIFVLESI